MGVDKSIIRSLREFQEEGKPDFLKELFHLFTSLTPNTLKQMEDCLQRGDAQGLGRLAHSLKSQSGNLGGRDMADQCSQLEALSRAAPFDALRVRSILDALHLEYRVVEKELKEIIFSQ